MCSDFNTDLLLRIFSSLEIFTSKSEHRELSATCIPSFITVELEGAMTNSSQFDKNDITKLKLTSSP
jgi:hypothetical protein